ncbi:MAG: hypothetical protein AAF750_17515, partial [Planctomycetota bacterium]
MFQTPSHGLSRIIFTIAFVGTALFAPHVAWAGEVVKAEADLPISSEAEPAASVVPALAEPVVGVAATPAKTLKQIVKTPEQWAKKLGTGDQFPIPQLVEQQRPLFGHEHGKVDPIDDNVLHTASPLLTYTAWGFVAVVILATLVIAFYMSRLRLEDGSTRRSLTLGTKLTLVFGGLTTMLVVIGAFAVTAMQSNFNSNQHLAFTAKNVSVVEEIERDLLHLELAAED